MRFLVIGLGSMGKRRIRNLLANGEHNIIGLDPREDRRIEAKEKYDIETIESIHGVDFSAVDAFVISVPPDKHMEYAHLAIDHDIHCFIEASVTDDGMLELIQKLKDHRGVRICPSCTLRFHPSVKLIKELVSSEAIGKVSHYSYHSGQYLPDWHPWEDIKDFYVSKRQTGGCREIVPFELAWINDIFGEIDRVCGFRDKTIDLGIDIDDVYSAAIKYRNGVLGNIVVDVVSRFAVRKLIINGDKGQILWDWNKKCVELYCSETGEWNYYHEPEGNAETGYNVNIIEEMYIDEIKNFINAINGKESFINSIEDDYQLLQYLYGIEKSSDTGIYTCF